MGLVDEDEIGVIFINAQDSVPKQIFLYDMGYTQPPTKIQIDNTTSDEFYRGTLKQNFSKTICMSFY